MKLSHWAKKQGITYLTAFRWFKSGRIPNARQMDTGTILVDDENNSFPLPKSSDCKVIIINSENTDSTVNDLLFIVKAFCDKLYGVRKGKIKVDKIRKVLNEETD